MNKYEVYVTAEYTRDYTIIAENEDDAIKEAKHG